MPCIGYILLNANEVPNGRGVCYFWTSWVRMPVPEVCKDELVIPKDAHNHAKCLWYWQSFWALGGHNWVHIVLLTHTQCTPGRRDNGNYMIMGFQSPQKSFDFTTLGKRCIIGFGETLLATKWCSCVVSHDYESRVSTWACWIDHVRVCRSVGEVVWFISLVQLYDSNTKLISCSISCV